MPFGTITGSTAATFEPRQPGTYVKSDLTFADPLDEYRINGASIKKDGSLSGSVTRVSQKDVTISGSTSRDQAVVSLSISVPSQGTFTAAEVDTLVADISDFLTTGTVSRLLQGEK